MASRGLGRREALVLSAGAAALALVAILGLRNWYYNDYDIESAPAYLALVRGHFAQFLSLVPGYGGSLLLRAPFAEVTRLWSGGETSVYWAVSLPCLLTAGGFGAWLLIRLRRLGVGLTAGTVALFLCAANPLALHALEFGHAEELLGAVLCVVAVRCAERDHATLAGLAVGIAIANKSWAVIAVPVVLLALPRHRPRALFAGAASAALLLVPVILHQHGGLTASVQTTTASNTGLLSEPQQLWWLLGHAPHVVVHRVVAGAAFVPGWRATPAWLNHLDHPGIVVACFAVAALWGWRRPRGGSSDALLVLALLLSLRCVLDTWNLIYYAFPAILALTAWECLERRRPPLLALAATLLQTLSFQALPRLLSNDLTCVAYLAWALPGLALLALLLLAPAWTEQRLAAWARAIVERLPVRVALELGASSLPSAPSGTG